MANKIKRLAGLKNIYVAKNNGGGWDTPVQIPGAKSVSIELEYSEVKFFADDINDFSDYQFAGGSGELVISGLTLEEYNIFFGSTYATGVTKVNSTDICPQLAIMFERRKLGTNDKILYVVYNVKFAPPTIEANTLEGDISEETITLPFTVSELSNGDVYAMADTGDETLAPGIADDWYTEVYAG